MSPTIGAPPDRSWILDAKIALLVRRKALQLARSPGFSRSDTPDIEQELTLELLEGSPRFDPQRAKATTFAKLIVENKAASMARAAGAQKRSYRRKAISLNASIDDGQGNVVEFASSLDESYGRRHTGQRRRSDAEVTQLRIDTAEANKDLPLELRELAALLSHVNQFAAGQVLGISRRQTADGVRQLRQLYEERGLEP